MSIEITITTSFLDRLAICETLGFPELWRFDGKTLQVQPAQLVPLLHQGQEDTDTPAIKEFQAWFRKEVLPTVKKNGSR